MLQYVWVQNRLDFYVLLQYMQTAANIGNLYKFSLVKKEITQNNGQATGRICLKIEYVLLIISARRVSLYIHFVLINNYFELIAGHYHWVSLDVAALFYLFYPTNWLNCTINRTWRNGNCMP